MTTSPEIKNLAAALATFHAEMGKVIKVETNPFFKSKYADLPAILDAIKEPLQKANLTFVQFPEGQNELTTILIHTESGEYMQATYAMPPTKNDPQGVGSAITYQRRYALGAILGLNIAEDDDGNAASKPAAAKAAAPTVTPYSATANAIHDCTTLDDLAALKKKVEASTKLDEEDKAKLADKITHKHAELNFVQ